MTGTGKSTGSAAFTRGTGKREGWKRHGKPGEAFNPGEMLVPLIKAEGAAALFAWLFYRSIPAFVLLQPLAVCLQRNFRRKERKRREQKLGGQFKDGLLAMAASLRAGHSAENAFEDAAGELAFLYGPEERITREFQRVTARTKMNVPLEQAVLNWRPGAAFRTFRLSPRCFRRPDGPEGSWEGLFWTRHRRWQDGWRCGRRSTPCCGESSMNRRS